MLPGALRTDMGTLANKLGLTGRSRLIKGPAPIVRTPRAAKTPPMRSPVAAHVRTPPATKVFEGIETGPGYFSTSSGTAAVGLDMRR